MTVRASFDDAKSWARSHLLFTGPGGYSDLAALSNRNIGCLYEGGRKNIAESIVFSAIPLDLLGRDAP